MTLADTGARFDPSLAPITARLHLSTTIALPRPRPSTHMGAQPGSGGNSEPATLAPAKGGNRTQPFTRLAQSSPIGHCSSSPPEVKSSCYTATNQPPEPPRPHTPLVTPLTLLHPNSPPSQRPRHPEPPIAATRPTPHQTAHDAPKTTKGATGHHSPPAPSNRPKLTGQLIAVAPYRNANRQA